MRRLISVVVPAYNESLNIQATFDSLQKSLSSIDGCDFEIIFINDGSSDDTLIKLRSLAKKHENTRYISFSRNFGKEPATSAGIQAAKGNAVILIDADGQHPPELIPKFVEKWNEGYEVIVGVRIANSGEGFIKKYGSKLFYKLLGSLTDGNTVPGSTDFRLLDRKVVDEFNKFTERGRITRGLIDWLGYNRTYIEFVASERTAGNASYSVNKLVKLAINAFVSQSTKPLQAVGVLGFIVTLLSAFLGIALIFETYVLDDPLNLSITGTAILAIFLSFLVGVVLACQGLLALYVESIHNETQNRPLYIIAESAGD